MKAISPVERLRRAYAANNIPWEPELARLPEATLLETAWHWEERAREAFGLESRPVPRGIGWNGRSEYIIREQERQYHGER